ncbi:MAG: DUF547 domain-containing protein [Proteobacteria bacterium]|nr:DUF547 domain-containing protein [Pseudomonadota bacterium]
MARQRFPLDRDNRQWALFLSAYRSVGSDGVARIAYGKLGRTGTTWLDRYVANLAVLPITTHRRSEQFTYWVNLYNALTVKLIAEHYPLNSIQDIDISRGLMAGPWSQPLITIEGRPVSLDDIQYRILRQGWNDARFTTCSRAARSAAPTCRRSRSAPIRSPSNWTPRRAPSSTTRAAPAWSTARSGCRRSTSYAADFGGRDWDAIQHVRRYAARPLASAMRTTSTVGGYDFDWSLNDV